jgi:NIPSNAP
MSVYSPIVELRQYLMYPQKRDTLISLFEGEFIEPQEALGMQVIGTFRDLDDPANFIWLRGFADMGAREKGLNAFYSGPVWQRFRAEANATMRNSDNVLLLREASPGSGFAPQSIATPAPRGAASLPPGLVIATIYYLNERPENGFAEFFYARVRPYLAEADIRVLAGYVPERSANNFPKLPVRENENVFVWFASYSHMADYSKKAARLDRLTRRHDGSALRAQLAKAPQILKLAPTARSLIRHEEK